MKPFVILLFIAAFTASTALSFFSGRFLRGFWPPVAFFFVCLLVATIYSSGWKIEGLGLMLGFTAAAMIAVGLPIAFISAVGAFAGLALFKRRKNGAHDQDA
jgi:hypothetical protein